VDAVDCPVEELDVVTATQRETPAVIDWTRVSALAILPVKRPTPFSNGALDPQVSRFHAIALVKGWSTMSRMPRTLAALSVVLAVVAANVLSGCAAKTPKPGAKQVNPEDGAEVVFVPVPAGNGVAAFEIGKYEVTVAQFRRFVEATGYKTTAEKAGFDYGYTGTEWGMVDGLTWRNGASLKEQAQDDGPVVHVSWEDAEAFCKWVGGRLPTQEEWEHAARGGLAGKNYVWGDDWPPPKGAGNFADAALKRKYTTGLTTIDGYDDGFAESAPVGSFKPNGYGLYDMAGNVWEWVSEQLYCRGGSFLQYCDPGNLAVSFRLNRFFSPNNIDLGFRVARAP
jgi:hypothetical protein